MRARPAIAFAAAALLFAAACSTQRFPGPMRPAVLPLPPGDISTTPPGPQEVIVFRHADPVQVRRAGEPAGFPLAFFDKRERVKSGAWVLCSAGGRCELLWPGDASAVMIFDECVCVIGEPSRDEPMLSFRKLTRARLILTPEDRVELMGGGILRGGPEDTSGPYVVERVSDDILRLVNQSKSSARIDFRDASLEIAPGEYVDLPLLAVGARPEPPDPTGSLLQVGGIEVFVVGRVEPVEDARGLRLRALESSTVRGRGVTVRLLAGEEVLLGAFRPGESGAPAPDPTDAGPEGGPGEGPTGDPSPPKPPPSSQP